MRGSESFTRAEISIESLRQRRMGVQLNFAGIVRMNLYAPGYEKEAGEATASPQTRTDWIAEGNSRAAAQSIFAK